MDRKELSEKLDKILAGDFTDIEKLADALLDDVDDHPKELKNLFLAGVRYRAVAGTKKFLHKLEVMSRSPLNSDHHDSDDDDESKGQSKDQSKDETDDCFVVTTRDGSFRGMFTNVKDAQSYAVFLDEQHPKEDHQIMGGVGMHTNHD